jgi:serine/threonine-protein kinase
VRSSGRPATSRRSWFALGAILFEILAGQSLLPRGRVALEAATRDVDARPSVRAPDRECPPEVEEIVVAATALDREKRPTARELGERIERFLDGDRDLALRKTLAARHLEAANAALASGDGVAERATAMREADPRGSGAAELVGRLMLEPPAQIPPDVTSAIERNEEYAARGKLRVMAFSMLAFLGVVPISWWVGLRSWSSMLWVTAAIALNLAHTWYLARRPGGLTAYDSARSVLLFGVLVAVIAREFSPFVMAPSIAAISVVLFLVDARARFSFIIATHVAAVVLPWVAELVGVAPRTIRSLPDGDLVFHAAAIYANQPKVEIALATFVVTTLISAGYIARQLAIAQRSAMQTTELQAWHLRQLVTR